MDSLDPRFSKVELKKAESTDVLSQHQCWETYEVFHQKKSGTAFEHVGSLHAAGSEMALIFAKEQYGRRATTHSIWVVKSTDIITFSGDAEKMFETTPEKVHREATNYKVRDKIDKFKKESATNE